MIEALFLFILLILLSHIVIRTLFIGISPLPSSIKVIKSINKLIKDKKTIIDLGSGFGFLISYLAYKNKDKNFIAYELSFIPFSFSLLLKKLFKLNNLNILKKDFLEESFENDVLLITYLFPKAMSSLEKKLIKDNFKGKLISNTFAFRKIKEEKTIYIKDLNSSKLYLYNLHT